MMLEDFSPLLSNPEHPLITRAFWSKMLRYGGCDRAGARDYAAFLGFFSLDPS